MQFHDKRRVTHSHNGEPMEKNAKDQVETALICDYYTCLIQGPE